MTAETVLTTLLRTHLVASVAILLVLFLRPLVLRWLGARTAYWLWLVVPVAIAASCVPARERVVLGSLPADVAVADEVTGAIANVPAAMEAAASQVAATTFASLPALADVMLAVWLLGAGVLLVRSIVNTRRLATDPSIGPALVGVLRPRLVLPADFETRFDAQERALILAHEEVHRVSGHTVVNALIEVARCAGWFNPLAHLAAIRIRMDQEIACDAAVIATRPTERSAYANALLKTQIAPAFLPLGCTWTSRSATRLRERIVMLGRPSGRWQARAGAAAVAVLGASLGYAAWAQQPERVLTQTAALPEAVWTPTANAPEGAISPGLESQRHDLFIERAKKGDIDIVFFGATDAEMWHWRDRGRSVWDRKFGSLKAANFGTQGTQPRTLLWRMQNGELGGYQAKLVVLQLLSPSGRLIPSDPRFPDLLAGYAAVIAEVRARQPQAKVLLFAPFPRGQVSRELWREISEANAAAITGLADNETVFYIDIGERFFRPDGSHNQEMWRYPPVSGLVNVGIQAPAFEAWTEALQPWIDRFVR